MQAIHLLDASIANKIAAGEVVERPASVVKELLENCIDAGSTRIYVDIEDAGKTLIRISDNGYGIPAKEVPLAFLRHATSKITTVEDIYAISSLGFRGEALASIAAVSKIEMVTKIANSDLGYKYCLEGGIPVEDSSVGTNNGTTITIRDLFYNTPARLKFMKSAASENMAILDWVQKIAISNPGVAIRYKNNGKTLFQSNGDGKRETILYDLWGAELFNELIQYKTTSNLFQMEAYFTRPHYTKGNRGYQMLIVNGRVVRSKQITDGVYEGYRSLLMANRFPAWLMILNLKPQQYDINIHPAKMEIKFQDENLIRNEMTSHTRAALLNSAVIHKIQSINTPEQTPVDIINPNSVTAPSHSALNEVWSVDRDTGTGRVEEQHIASTARVNAFNLLDAMVSYASTETKLKSLSTTEQLLIPDFTDKSTGDNRSVYMAMSVIGVFKGAYILTEHLGSLYIIDQHAAHERILYEYFLSKEGDELVEKQGLILPLTLEVSTKMMLCFDFNQSYFEQIGFNIDKLGSKTLVVRETPSILTLEQSQRLINEVLDLLIVQEGTERMQNFETFAMMACKSAVKAHDYLTIEEVKRLLYDLSLCENPFTCPHGRPIAIEMTEHEIEKKFKRT